MGRSVLHKTDGILDAARGLLLRKGIEGATVAEIAKAARWPVGSIYHRFRSRDELLAHLWVRAAKRSQAAFFDAIAVDDPREAAVAGALSVFDFVAGSRDDARLLLAFRRTDLIRDVRDPALLRDLEALNEPMADAITLITQGIYGEASREALDRVLLAIVDIPLGAIRRPLLEDRPLPPILRHHMETAVRAVLDDTRRTEP
jgi:AcrR family transcriptional regulator